jgi:PAS domain S-box-containing protein
LEKKGKASTEDLALEIVKKDKIIAALMSRVEQGMKTTTGSFSLFQSNILLSQEVQKRTKELEILTKDLRLEREELKAKTFELDKLNNFKKSIIESLLDALLVLDEQGHILHYNTQAQNLFGHDGHGSIENVKIGEFVDDFDFSKTKDKLTRDKRVMVINRLGDFIHCQLSITVMNSDDETNKGYICILKNLTERISMENIIEEERMKSMNAARLASLGEMAGGIAHEINNPLMIISGRVSIIRKHLKKEETDIDSLMKSLDTINKTLDRINKIILGLRVVSRESNEFKRDTICYKDIFDNILVLCYEKFKYLGIDLKVNMDDVAFSYSIFIDQVQISQVLVNLFSNASDAVADLQEKWIEIKITRHSNYDVIRITDSGAGVPLEIQDKVFNPFYTSKDVGKGTGLGLSISKSIMNKHGGDLEIDKQCENTSFLMTLPTGFLLK